MNKRKLSDEQAKDVQNGKRGDRPHYGLRLFLTGAEILWTIFWKKGEGIRDVVERPVGYVESPRTDPFTTPDESFELILAPPSSNTSKTGFDTTTKLLDLTKAPGWLQALEDSDRIRLKGCFLPGQLIHNETQCIIILQAYERIFEALVGDGIATSSGGNAMIVGDSGTGKSTALDYFLFRRLLKGLPTVFRNDIGIWLFTDEGVLWKEEEVTMKLLELGPLGKLNPGSAVWILWDDEGPNSPKMEFEGIGLRGSRFEALKSDFRFIFAPRLKRESPDDLGLWDSLWQPSCYHLNTWLWEELITLKYMFKFPIFGYQYKGPGVTEEVFVARLHIIYMRYGGVPARIFITGHADRAQGDSFLKNLTCHTNNALVRQMQPLPSLPVSYPVSELDLFTTTKIPPEKVGQRLPLGFQGYLDMEREAKTYFCASLHASLLIRNWSGCTYLGPYPYLTHARDYFPLELPKCSPHAYKPPPKFFEDVAFEQLCHILATAATFHDLSMFQAPQDGNTGSLRKTFFGFQELTDEEILATYKSLRLEKFIRPASKPTRVRYTSINHLESLIKSNDHIGTYFYACHRPFSAPSAFLLFEVSPKEEGQPPQRRPALIFHTTESSHPIDAQEVRRFWDILPDSSRPSGQDRDFGLLVFICHESNYDGFEEQNWVREASSTSQIKDKFVQIKLCFGKEKIAYNWDVVQSCRDNWGVYWEELRNSVGSVETEPRGW
ncbi:hypothetical protein BJ508DRAFT_413791 [Ascobolus immersus RN42]|uniref:Uncharacterized protein n=1 Tax=Ascobolus immersus RN42 TaxID=1160509 RepID=A0A3N4IDU0_ASCIM|nr:hypothetical protein BJ508DRAFT_413791 [Ascobolus immersus RN42]